MRVLLIALQQPVTCQRAAARTAHDAAGEDAAAPGAVDAALKAARMEEEQALALGLAMRDGGRLAPLLVCRRGSWLHARAAELGIPLLVTGGLNSSLFWPRLFFWQRRHKRLLIQTIGAGSVAFGRRVLALRRKGSALLSHAFFLRPPQARDCRGRAMRLAGHILCGSSHVRDCLLDAWEGGKGTPGPRPELHLLAPGIPLEEFRPDGVEPDATGPARFVLGMGSSLAPRSGALLVVRAMAALWQREDLPAWELRMFGSGPRFHEVLREAENLGVASRLCILDDQPPAEALAHCRAWLAPGSSPEELPATLWAGFAAGLPVICTQSALHRERLAHAPAAAALRVEEQDPQALARAMIAVMRDERLRRRLSMAGSALAATADIRTMAARACALFESWLDEAGGDHSAAAAARDSSPRAVASAVTGAPES